MTRIYSIVVIAFMISAPASAGLRCGNALVSDNDSAIEVLGSCGEPDYRSVRYAPGTDIAIGERWFYNRGPRRLIQVVHIRRGRVSRVETAGRGFTGLQRCKPLDIEPGWSDFELLGRCGEPSLRASFWGSSSRFSSTPRRQLTPGGRFHTPYADSKRQSVWVEEWQYNFGENQFIRLVRLENGVVANIETSGYGFER